MSKSDDLRLTYLQQFKRYLLPLVPLPLKTRPQLCWLPQPLLPKYNPVPLLEAQAHQEEEEVHLAEEEACLAEEEEETPHKPLSVMESPWACYPPYLREIAQKLRAFSESFPLTSLLTMTSQHLPHSSKELLLPSHVSKDRKSTNGHNNNSSGWWPYSLLMTTIPHISNSSLTSVPASWTTRKPKEPESSCKHWKWLGQR